MKKSDLLREFSRQLTFVMTICNIGDSDVKLLGKAMRLIDLEAEKLDGALDDYLDD